MTLTKYQRGDAIEGWNDCPVYIPTSSSSSSINSSASKASRKRLPRRISHNLNGSQLSGSSTPVSVPSTPLIPTQHLSSSVNLERDLKKPNNIPTSSQENGTVCESDLSDATINHKLEELLRHPTTLQENEIKHYQNKLTNNVASLKEDDKSFLYDMITRALDSPTDGDNKAAIKQEILAYMMANLGVSSWCAPLKKTIEGLKANT